MSKQKSPVKRIVITIFLCLLVISAAAVWRTLNIANPNMEDSLFVPVTVKDVADDKDIVVPVTGVAPQPKDSELPEEMNLNDLDHGWLVYDKWGKCRIIFETEKSFTNYAYAENIPRSRLSLDDKLDEFSVIFRAQQHPSTDYYIDDIGGGVYMYPVITKCTRQAWLVNAIVIAGAVVVNILLSDSFKERKKRT